MPTIHFETLGCKLNQIETESLAHAFSGAGFTVDLEHTVSGESVTPLDDQSSPDSPLHPLYLPVGIQNHDNPILCVVNTCTVTGKAEQKARRLIRLLLRKFPAAPVLVTGCYAEVEGETISAMDPRIVVFPGSRKDEIASIPASLSVEGDRPDPARILAILRARAGLPIQAATHDPFRLSTDEFVAHSRASIKIQDGCDNHCAYCKIRLARGPSVSIDPDEAVRRVREIERSGWREVVLAGVNLSQYRSSGGNFAHLLGRIIGETDSIAIRISSLYPERVNEEILPILASPRVRPHFHLSVQSGSDRILRSMRRPYGADTVYRAAELLRSVKDDPFLACDIITGFPGETDEDFEQTFRMCKDIGFAGIHAFPFSARPGTEAWSMRPKVPERIAGERVTALTEHARGNFKDYAARWTGKTIEAIVEESTDSDELTVLTANYLSLRISTANLTEIPPRGSSILIRPISAEMGEIVL
ncbi:MAG TPA: tRNA (N(6)-L-threonylcarbamoyladenosine(37)-C(2))-methylthiotransferase MtaB [Treponemataceae bacterium]|nr:tRNA (N(6)-L-threonylcarbamoyladenosine(37)-C(2))-methylthiotransferase MtaB [Treponemataceae bacterium]